MIKWSWEPGKYSLNESFITYCLLIIWISYNSNDGDSGGGDDDDDDDGDSFVIIAMSVVSINV
jgi:hypothetical protein